MINTTLFGRYYFLTEHIIGRRIIFMQFFSKNKFY